MYMSGKFNPDVYVSRDSSCLTENKHHLSQSVASKGILIIKLYSHLELIIQSSVNTEW